MCKTQLHVALLSSAVMGHLIPVTILGNHLAIHHNIKVTVLAITTSSSRVETQILKGHSDGKKVPIDIIPIPSLDVSGLIDSTTKVFTQLRIIVRESLPGVRSAISNLNPSLDALIVDLFCTSAMHIADEFNIPKYVYHTSNAWSTALIVYTQIFDKQIQGQYVNLNEPLVIPGCIQYST
ncbi:hypothetical protein RND71_034294 [Anisodus tanguticus]|uniref:Uncharacterized protein n=1 Tax=Anisodus tanguticus TaxID=243964 RepID=A0AAE1RA94_9SOLA|nr:hypothetical protein RND71_034294 [Anisodus tanguticus]